MRTLLILLLAASASAKPVVLAPGSKAPKSANPWGGSRCDPATLTRVRMLVQACARGSAKSFFSDLLVMGPALWKLVGKDAALQAAPDKKSFSARPQADGTTVQEEMRTFDGAPDVKKLLQSAVWTAVAEHFAQGEVRPASEEERRVFYGEIPFEIARTPIAVVQKDQDVLLVLLEKNRVMWLELLSLGVE